MSHDNSTMTVWIEAENWASGEWTPDNDSTDVIVTLEDGAAELLLLSPINMLTH